MAFVLDTCSELALSRQYDEDQSTVAGSELDDSLQVDDELLSAGEENKQKLDSPFQKSSCEKTQIRTSGSRKFSQVCWADLDNSDDDRDSQKTQCTSSGKVSRAEENSEAPKARWADLVDDESDSPLNSGASMHQRVLQIDVVEGNSARLANSSAWNKDAGSCHSSQKVNASATSTWWSDNSESSVTGKGKGKGKGKDRDHSQGWNTGKGAGKTGGPKGNAKGNAKGNGKGSNEKFQCQFIIGIEEDAKFRVVRRILGTGGEHMKSIAGETDAKLRLRGRGSKFLEGPEKKESTDDLMLCVSSQDNAGFLQARKLVTDLLEDIYECYNRLHPGKNNVGIKIHEGARAGSR